MKKLVTICAVLFLATAASAGITASIYVDSMSLNYTSSSETVSTGMWYQIEHWASTAESAVKNGTFVDMSNGTYPGTHSISVYDDVVATSGSSGVGKAVVWLFDLKTDAAATVQIRELCTYTYVDNGTTYTYDDVDGALITGSIDSAAWQSIYNSSPYSTSITLSAGDNVYEGWWDYINATDTWSLSHLTAINYYVEYSTNSGSTWVLAASDVVNVVPEPATMCLLGLGGLALLKKRKF